MLASATHTVDDDDDITRPPIDFVCAACLLPAYNCLNRELLAVPGIAIVLVVVSIAF